MKRCLLCHVENGDAVPTCGGCGLADFTPPAPPEPEPEPEPEKPKRGRPSKS